MPSVRETMRVTHLGRPNRPEVTFCKQRQADATQGRQRQGHTAPAANVVRLARRSRSQGLLSGERVKCGQSLDLLALKRASLDGPLVAANGASGSSSDVQGGPLRPAAPGKLASSRRCDGAVYRGAVADRWVLAHEAASRAFRQCRRPARSDWVVTFPDLPAACCRGAVLRSLDSGM